MTHFVQNHILQGVFHHWRILFHKSRTNIPLFTLKACDIWQCPSGVNTGSCVLSAEWWRRGENCVQDGGCHVSRVCSYCQCLTKPNTLSFFRCTRHKPKTFKIGYLPPFILQPQAELFPLVLLELIPVAVHDVLDNSGFLSRFLSCLKCIVLPQLRLYEKNIVTRNKFWFKWEGGTRRGDR